MRENASPFEVQDWGLIEYNSALKKQEELVEQVSQSQSRGVLVFCQHPAVVTLGRSTRPGDVTSWKGPTLEVSRGGRATYHGPSQMVIYPIVNLNLQGPQRPAKDIAAYLRNFENSIVEILKEYGVNSQGRSLQKKVSDPEHSDETGVWIGNQKIASLGIAVRKWVSFHGAALNVYEDPLAFQGLKPCGFEPSVMTNLQQQMKLKLGVDSKIDFATLQTKIRVQLDMYL